MCLSLSIYIYIYFYSPRITTKVSQIDDVVSCCDAQLCIDHVLNIPCRDLYMKTRWVLTSNSLADLHNALYGMRGFL